MSSVAQENLQRFVRLHRQIAEDHGLTWALPCNPLGKIDKSQRWDLNEMTGASGPKNYIGDFGCDDRALLLINERRATAGQSLLPHTILPQSWREFIKAVAVKGAFRDKTSPSHISRQTVRYIRILGTCAYGKDLWNLTADDVCSTLEFAKQINTAVTNQISYIVKHYIDVEHLSDCSPLLIERFLTQNKSNRSPLQIRKELEERKRAEQLPNAKAFWELVRILWEEKPATFYDRLRFEMARLLLLLGLRGTEIASIPEDCIRWREYFDPKGNRADTRGGIGKSLWLRIFALKQALKSESGLALYETTINIDPEFEQTVLSSVERIKILTKPLRERLRQQRQTGRIFPEFTPDSLVSLLEVYTRLSADYNGSGHAVIILDKIESRQILRNAAADKFRRKGNGGFRKAVRNYFSKKCGEARKHGIPLVFRLADGCETGHGFRKLHVRISDLEAWAAKAMPTKLSDVEPLNLDRGQKLYPDELLLLGPKRVMIEERDGIPCDVRKYPFVGNMTIVDVINGLSQKASWDRFGQQDGSLSLFQKYGETAEDCEHLIETHDFRHLWNTEMFRAGLADTILSKRFNRKSVAQSYEYDHRSLAEELDVITVPAELDPLLLGKARDVYKLIMTGRGKGKIADQFMKIQKNEGEEVSSDRLFSGRSRRISHHTVRSLSKLVCGRALPSPSRVSCWLCPSLSNRPSKRATSPREAGKAISRSAQSPP
ncbi:hypothetical protein [Flexibacterium corallicola]|uniref:hypothetical protein n=1 Tax=Flexibacterium corallicola TaxID=3037259 RepID=UPI00286F773B|nr:hypothetical protein [Pseudovibrio sp. M1P-2-3]